MGDILYWSRGSQTRFLFIKKNVGVGPRTSTNLVPNELVLKLWSQVHVLDDSRG